MEFFLNISLNSLNSVTEIFVITVKGSILPHRQQDTCRDRIFKLSPIYASVIFKFLKVAEFSESSALFRKNSNRVHDEKLDKIRIQIQIVWKIETYQNLQMRTNFLSMFEFIKNEHSP